MWPTRALVTCLVASSIPGPALAGGLADEAELNFQLGFESYDRGEFRDALAHFMASHRLVPNANVSYNAALTLERLGQFPDAYRWYQDTLRADPDAETVALIQEALARIGPKVAVFEVTTTPPGAQVFANRKDLGSIGITPVRVAFPPGTYTILVELEGHLSARSAELRGDAGTMTPVTLALPRIQGKVRVDASEPAAEVRAGSEVGEVACQTPCELDLPPGTHILFVGKDGFRSVPVQARVEAEQTTTVAATLAPLTGTVVVSTSERAALVEIDGRPAGYTPVVVPGVRVGTREVRVTVAGYEPFATSITVEDGEEVDLRDLVLVPIREVQAASRLPEAIEDAPSSVTLITRQELRAFAYPTVYEALRGVRGIALGYDSVYGSASVRGLGQANEFGNRLLVLSDGAILNDNILFQSFTTYDQRADLLDVDHIEVVRGAGSVLYGTGAVSGVVNLAMRGTGGPTRGTVAVGTAENGVATGRGALDLNLGEDAGLWASVAGARSDGWDTELALPSGPATVRGMNAFEAATTAGKLHVRDLDVQWFGTTRSVDIPTGAYGTQFDSPGTVWGDTRALVEARFEPQLSESAQLFARAYGNYYAFEGDYRFEGANPARHITFREVYRGLWAGVEPRFVLSDPSADARWRLSVGGELVQSLEASLSGISLLNPETPYLDENEPYTLAAGYALVDWKLGERLRLNAGGRYDYWSTFAGGSFNPRVALIARPTEPDVIKLMAGKAFRAPSIYELLYNDGGFAQLRSDEVPGNELGPESVYSGELEATHAFDEHWVGLLSLHGLYATSLIETVPLDPTDPDTPAYTRNTDVPATTGGLDVELRRELSHGWMFAAMAGGLLANYTDPPEGATGTRMPNAPFVLASLKTIAPLYDPLAVVALRLSLEGPRRLTRTRDEVTDPAVVADVVLSGTRHESGLFYNAGVYNLFDWKYGAPMADNFAAPLMPQNGRTFLAKVGVEI